MEPEELGFITDIYEWIHKKIRQYDKSYPALCELANIASLRLIKVGYNSVILEHCVFQHSNFTFFFQEF